MRKTEEAAEKMPWEAGLLGEVRLTVLTLICIPIWEIKVRESVRKKKKVDELMHLIQCDILNKLGEFSEETPVDWYWKGEPDQNHHEKTSMQKNSAPHLT